MNKSILKKMFHKIPPIDGMMKRYRVMAWMPTEDIKETFKILTQRENHEIDLCKKYVQNTLGRKGK